MKSLKGLGNSKKSIVRVVLKDKVVAFEIYNFRKELKFNILVSGLLDEYDGECTTFNTFDEAYDFYNKVIN